MDATSTRREPPHSKWLFRVPVQIAEEIVIRLECTCTAAAVQSEFSFRRFTKLFLSNLEPPLLQRHFVILAVHVSILRTRSMTTFQWICRRCARSLRAPQNQWSVPKRHLHDRWLQRQYAAELEWMNQAAEIREGSRKGMLAILEERGFVNQITG